MNRRVYLNFATDEAKRMKKITEELEECRLQMKGYSELLVEYENEAAKRSSELDAYKGQVAALKDDVEVYKMISESGNKERDEMKNMYENRIKMLREMLANLSVMQIKANSLKEPINKSAANPTGNPAAKPAAKLVAKLVTKLVANPAAKPAAKLTSKPTEDCEIPIKKPKLPIRSSSRIRARALVDQTNKKK